MPILHISYSVYRKNAKRGSVNYYCRVRENQKTVDINLHTTDKAKADAYVRLRRSEVQRYNDYVVAGEKVPPDLEDLIVRPIRNCTERGLGAVLTVRGSVDSFDAHLRRTGHRTATVATYLRALRNCLDFDAPLSAVDERFLSDGLRKHDGLKSATRKSYCVACREWVKFCVKEYGMRRDLIDSFNFVKVQSVERGYWTMTEIRRLIDAIKCRDDATTRTYKAWCWLMATTGARQGEASLIEWSDLKEGNVTFRAETTKNGVSRTVPLTIGVLELINQLPKVNKKVFAYLGRTQASRYAVVVKAVKEAKVSMGSLHTFRHSASMYLYKRISDIKLVSQILGHSAQTALKYYQANREVEKVGDALSEAYSEERNLPSSMDSLIEEGFI